MKALKVWGWISLAVSVILFCVGLFGGEFNRTIYGTSDEARMLTVFSAMFLLVAVAVWLVVHAVNSKND